MTRLRSSVHTCEHCGRTFYEQNPYVLHLLEHAGGRGIHTFELRRLFVGNPSQRVAELEAQGHTIRHRRERLNGAATGTRYTLLPGLAASTMTVEAPVGVALMGGVVVGRESVQHDDDGWRRDWLCVRCAYRPAGGPACARGHDAILGWVFGDAPAERALELPVAA